MKKTLALMAILSLFVAVFVGLDRSTAKPPADSAQQAQAHAAAPGAKKTPEPPVVPAQATTSVAEAPRIIVIEEPEQDEIPPGAVAITDPVELAQFWEGQKQAETRLP